MKYTATLRELLLGNWNDAFIHWHESFIWCSKKFGLPGERRNNHNVNTTFHFRDEDDYVQFCLRWL